jgi:hypothetical protein
LSKRQWCTVSEDYSADGTCWGYFPHQELIEESQRRARRESEYELCDTGLFEQEECFDVEVELAQARPEDILLRYIIDNRAEHAASLQILPLIWLRNNWG